MAPAIGYNINRKFYSQQECGCVLKREGELPTLYGTLQQLYVLMVYMHVCVRCHNLYQVAYGKDHNFSNDCYIHGIIESRILSLCSIHVCYCFYLQHIIALTYILSCELELLETTSYKGNSENSLLYIHIPYSRKILLDKILKIHGISSIIMVT